MRSEDQLHLFCYEIKEGCCLVFIPNDLWVSKHFFSSNTFKNDNGLFVLFVVSYLSEVKKKFHLMFYFNGNAHFKTNING